MRGLRTRVGETRGSPGSSQEEYLALPALSGFPRWPPPIEDHYSPRALERVFKCGRKFIQNRKEEKSQTHSTLGPLGTSLASVGPARIVWVWGGQRCWLRERRLEARLEGAGSSPGSEEGQWGLGTEWPLGVTQTQPVEEGHS